MSQRNDSPDDISVIDVTKDFRVGVWRRRTAVHQLSFSVPRGHIVGLLGPNGSGKSTTLKMIVGFLRPTSGDILICGERAEERASRRHLGYLPENPRFQRFLRGIDALRYYGSLHGLDRAELERRIGALLEMVDLKHAANERIGTYSKGMTQRLAIAQALVNRPRILLFDEPMSGLDPIGRMDIRGLIARIHDEMPEATIFFSSHVLADVEALCSHVALLRTGRLHRYCAINELLAGDRQRFEVVVTDLAPALRDRYQRDRKLRPTPAGLSILIEGADALAAQLAEMRESGAQIVGVSAQRWSLEEALFRERPSMAAGGSL